MIFSKSAPIREHCSGYENYEAYPRHIRVDDYRKACVEYKMPHIHIKVCWDKEPAQDIGDSPGYATLRELVSGMNSSDAQRLAIARRRSMITAARLPSQSLSTGMSVHGAIRKQVEEDTFRRVHPPMISSPFSSIGPDISERKPGVFERFGKWIVRLFR